MGFKFAPEVSDELFSFFDKDDGGSVTLEEIEATLKWGRDRKSARPLLAGWRQLAHMAAEADVSLHEQLRRRMNDQGKNVTNVFKNWDENGDGFLDKYELGILMFALCGMTLSEKELDQLFKSFDVNNDGNISLKELNSKLREEVPVEQLMSALSKPEVEENLFDLFHSSWDTNGDGVLDRSEFAAALRGLGVTVKNTTTGSAFDDLFTMLDEDGSGSISLRELQNSLRWIRSCEKCELLRSEAYEFEGTLSIQTQIRRALAANSVRVMDLFREWDQNGDGVLEMDEFLRAMPMLGIHAGKKEVDDLFKSMDGDGDGIVTFKEFNRMMRRENEAMMKDDEQGADGRKRPAWRPKSPKITLADLVSLRGTVKMENKLRGLESVDITPVAKLKSPAEKGATRRAMKKATSAAAVVS
jgi:Ca2+-binding EF-hand superfamily protein